MILAILIPVVVLVALAILLPRLLLPLMPETLAGLVLNGAISAVVLTVLACGWFFGSYLVHDTRLVDLFGLAPGGTLLYFLRLGLMSALIWAPVLVLAVASLPKRWKHATW